MKTTSIAKFILALLAVVSGYSLLEAAPPTPVSEMDKKELKIYKRDVKKYSFETQTFKDSSSGITWLQSPVLSDPSTPSMRHYFRTGFLNGSIVTNQVIVSHLHIGFNEYDRKTMDYTAFKLDGKTLPTEVGDPLRDPANDAITQISAITIPVDTLLSHAETGMDLKAVNSFGETDVPIRAALTTAYSNRLQKEKEKQSKKK